MYASYNVYEKKTVNFNQKPFQRKLRVVQIIDSLDAGGGERMAVTLANALNNKVDYSGLVVTRKEGSLKNNIDPNVPYCFLNKKKKIDLIALRKLLQFIKINHINLIHAHATSFFTATLIKMIKPDLKIIWHDHYGESEALDQRPQKIIKFSSYFFDAIFSVNQKLQIWAQEKLKCKTVEYIKNFSESNSTHQNNKFGKSLLKGSDSSFQIVQVANLRVQKDHLNALQAINKLKREKIDVNLHLIGAFQKDEYYQKIVQYIKNNNLKDVVFIYGSRSDVPLLLEQFNMGLLSSRSEGLPVSLLEYAKAHLPVVVTDVGQCKEVVGNNGKVVPKNEPDLLAGAIKFYIQNPQKAKHDANRLKNKVNQDYGEQKIIRQIIDLYQKVLLS